MYIIIKTLTFESICVSVLLCSGPLLEISVADSALHGPLLGSGYEPRLLRVKLPVIKSAVTDVPLSWPVDPVCIMRCTKRAQLPPSLTPAVFCQTARYSQ
jgi:hypothetical protein